MAVAIKEDTLKAALASRLDTLFSDMLSEQDLVAVASLNDIELAHRFYIQTLENHSNISSRVRRKLKKRAQAEKSFYEDLERLGGTMKAKDVAEILGVSRQTVNNRLKSNKLVAIKKGGDYIYPAFQFKDGGMLPYFEELNQLLGDSADAIARISYFICTLNDGGEDLTPLDILRKDQPTETELMRLKRSASLSATHIAK